MERNNDHDLLIEVNTKLGTLIGEMQLMRDSTNTRLSNVETFKVDKGDFIEYKTNVDKMLNELKQDIFRTMDERSQNRDKELETLTKAIAELTKQTGILNRNMYIILGMGLLLEVLIPILSRAFFKL